MIKKRPSLSELERTVIEVLWTKEQATVDSIMESLPGRRKLKGSTIRTVLSRLEKKKFVTHKVESRTNVYRAICRPDELAIGSVRQIVDRFLGGSIEALLVGMVKQDLVNSDELEVLARKIADEGMEGEKK